MSKTQLTKDNFYPLADYHVENFTPKNGVLIMAKYAGEYRPVKAGEWYFSGAIIEAYQAKKDLITSFHIARLCKVRKEVKEVITELNQVS